LALIGAGLWAVALRPLVAPIPARAQEPTAFEQLPKQAQALLDAVRDREHPIPIALVGGPVTVRLQQNAPLRTELAGPTEVTVSAGSEGLPVMLRQTPFAQLRVKLEDSDELRVRVTDFDPDPLPVRMR